jgi:hypothetical protein
MFHFDRQGRLENGEVRFQLKASDGWRVGKSGTSIACQIKTGDLNHWQFEFYPFILVLFDAQTSRAYWMHIQEYMAEHPEIDDSDCDTVRVHVPIINELNLEAIERFRTQSLATMRRLANQGGFSDARRDPR